jgi:hypothetical protein
MKNVSIFIKTSTKNIRKAEGEGIYLLEYKKDGAEPVTMCRIYSYEETWLTAELLLLTGALRRMREKCHIDIYSECRQIQGTMERFSAWAAAGWKYKGGQDVPDFYRELAELTAGHEINIISEQHEYSTWMETELKRAKEKRECLKDLENLMTSRK